MGKCAGVGDGGVTGAALSGPQIRCSAQGLGLIRASEGLRLEAYHDTGGVLTIGYGHTRGVLKIKGPITRDEAERLLREDVAEAEDTIRAYVPHAVCEKLPQAAWDALVDFVFNLGHQAFRNPRDNSRTGIARALDDRRWFDVPAQLRRWVYDDGKKQRGLEIRRDAECVMWNSADWSGVL